MNAPANLAEAADSLALAVIASSNAPVLLLDDSLTIVAASDSFGETFQVDPDSLNGLKLAKVGEGEWAVPQLAALLRATASGSAEVESYEMELVRNGKAGRCLIVNARKLAYFDAEHIRLVMSIADVTEARINDRLKDDLLREKGILLQELQHRVANSLQIIASVLMQSARRMRSPRARGQLQDARNRVMSIAALQRQLSVSNLEDVALRTYFTELCASIGASMIDDSARITLDVEVDGSAAGADVSVSLGLIVTELVINALKHAFPGRRRGAILVSYRSDGPSWTLSVRDDGIGPPAHDAVEGLGTGIVQALARHLRATVTVSDSRPGTTVTITCG